MLRDIMVLCFCGLVFFVVYGAIVYGAPKDPS